MGIRGLSKLFDLLTPSHLKVGLQDQEALDLAFKSRVLVTTLLVFSLIVAGLATYEETQPVLLQGVKAPLYPIVWIASAMMLACTIFFRITGRYRLTVIIWISMGLAIITLRVAVSGGLNSPNLVWLSLAPVLSAFFLGVGSAYVATLGVFASILLVHYWNITHSDPFNSQGYQFSETAKFFTVYFAFIAKGYFVTQTEIERQRYENEYKKTQAHLSNSSKFAALGEMASGVAHEINTPLAVIKMIAEQLEEDLKQGKIDDQKLRSAIHKIHITSQRIAKIIHGLRTFARDGSHDPLESADFTQLLQTTLDLCDARLKAMGVEILLPRSPATFSIQCRPTQISQVLLNLINNAVDAVQNLEQKWIRIELTDTEDQIQIGVIDSGSGILPETAQKLFEPFFTTKETGKGTGLGLSISRGIIESHDGTLTLDPNCPNTRFVIRLPKLEGRTELNPSTRAA